ncbi:MAG: trans-aconitate 2-methyltransferase [Burkholderiaceae bacterium]
MRSTAFRQLAGAAADPYRSAGRFAHGFARGKLLGDPAFEHLLAQGLLSAPETQMQPGTAPAARPVRILDLGCGQCLLAALLPAAAAAHRRGDWPAGWPAPPQAQIHGIELMPADVARARAALGDTARIEAGDITTAPYSTADVVVILDVLHYIDYAAQERVLQRVAQALAPHGGRLLLRVGDAAGGWRFRASQAVDALVTFVRGHRLGRLYCRSLADWRAALQRHGFQVRTQALSAGTPFANVLLIAERPAGAAAAEATPESARRNGPSPERPQTLPA